MFSVQEAKELLFNSALQLPAFKIASANSFGYVLAEDILAPCDVPFFNQSAMDGYAICLEGIPTGNDHTFLVTGEIKAGGKPVSKLKNNTAIGIYTGAAVPQNASCVIMQEKTFLNGDYVTIPSSAIIEGTNIRLRGSQIRKGERALSKGHLLNPASIGFICSMGITEISVINKPVVSILVTGDEIKKPGTKLLPGQIFESNSFMLDAAIKQTGFSTNETGSVIDDEEQIFSSIKKLLKKSDVLIISGGISVGKYDLVKKSLTEHKINEIFYKVSQKPGKPLFAGMKDKKIVFALPGNPAASLVCFYEYILPVLRTMSGQREAELPKELIPLAHSFEMKGDRDLFLRAKIENGTVRILDGQESNILKSFAEANALVYIPEGAGIIKKGEQVETHQIIFN